MFTLFTLCIYHKLLETFQRSRQMGERYKCYMFDQLVLLVLSTKSLGCYFKLLIVRKAVVLTTLAALVVYEKPIAVTYTS